MGIYPNTGENTARAPRTVLSAAATRARVAAMYMQARGGTPLVMVTAYDFVTADIVDSTGVDFVLVGDSAATTVLGYTNTRDVTVDELLVLTRAARRGVSRALLVGDLPFGSYESSDAQAVATARAFVDAGCELVKLEGAGAMLERVRAIVEAGIPVVGHVGLLPQAHASLEALRAHGRTAADALAIVADAEQLVRAGCTLLVVEAVPSAVGAAIAAHVMVPVIGIGAGPAVDGQVLVVNDLLGWSDGRRPRFVRAYGNLREAASRGVTQFANDVRTHAYPASAEEYGMPDAERVAFEHGLLAMTRTPHVAPDGPRSARRPLGGPEGAR